MKPSPATSGQCPGVGQAANAAPSGQLLSILGVGFGIAGAVGGSIGAGILRTPGLVAAQLGNGPLILAAWALGGLYVLLGALAVAELGAAMPRAGGWTIYARRALGDQAGFAVGWIDWIGHCAGLAWVVVTIGAYATALIPSIPLNGTGIALLVLLLFALIQLIGLEAGRLSQELLSLVKALAFLALISACLLLSPGHGPELAVGAGGPAPPEGATALVVAAVFALQAVITTYDGWQSPIYFAEEFNEPSKDLPRSVIGGLLVVIGLVLLVNLALLKVLPIAELAVSDLPLADAARALFGPLSGRVILVLALISSLGLVNTSIMCAPRILFGLSRDGLFLGAFARVRAGGTPVNALIATALLTSLLVLFGDFERLLGVAALLYVLLYLAGMVSMLVLRWKEPELPRPFKAPGGSWAAAIVALGSLAFLVAAALSDTTNCLLALALVALSLPLRWAQRRWGEAAHGQET